jgi:AcrR family transcriptional regulator
MLEQSSPASAPQHPRERLLATAGHLFYTEGIRAIGVDRLVSEANVTRATFYRHFDGKDDLVRAYIYAQDLEIRSRYEAATQDISQPTDLLRAVAIDIAQMVCGMAFRGCPFINAAVEYPDPDSQIHQAVAEHRTWFHATLLELFTAARHPEPGPAARRLVLLRDGAMIGGCLGAPDDSIEALNAGLGELLGLCREPKPGSPATASQPRKARKQVPPSRRPTREAGTGGTAGQ